MNSAPTILEHESQEENSSVNIKKFGGTLPHVVCDCAIGHTIGAQIIALHNVIDSNSFPRLCNHYFTLQDWFRIISSVV